VIERNRSLPSSIFLYCILL